MHLVLEALEDDLARLELPDGRSIDVPRDWLPAEAQPNHHLDVVADGTGYVIFTIDVEATQKALEANQALTDQLNAKDPGGNLKL